ncbi:vanillate monooxygenase [Acetobacter oeni]|uniref:Vanillate monooxygenase n=1 Tax=Acetobacter oeni TaxID=304077 RepID=A0A511XG62_9PROT|nr:aromatic ring-hydroxylating dioxygenase subunit alpha [Acetobacter oeni]GEN61940.1 vanillate monooxygenase [Acetobacter oeni]
MVPYPFSEGNQSWPRHQWYIAAWSREVGSVPLMRKILDQEIVFFRTASGRATAVSGLCPHRQMPLATAQIVDDQLICPYHGAAFDAEGRCARLPFQEHIPGAMNLRSFAVEEKGPFIWVWDGDASTADIGLLPDVSSLGLMNENYSLFGCGLRHVRARSQIVLENLFDHSHITFTHAASLGTRTQAEGPPKSFDITDRAGYLAFRHSSPCRPVTEAMRLLFPAIGSFMRVDYRVELFGVALVNTVGTESVSCDEQGESQATAGRMNFFHGITPETATTTHYFLGGTRDFGQDNDDYTSVLAERNERVVDEDIKLLESIEPYLERTDARSEPNFTTDATAIRVRRRIERLMQEGAGAGHVTAETAPEAF